MPQPEKRVKIIISFYIIKASAADINSKLETTANYLVFSVFLLCSYRYSYTRNIVSNRNVFALIFVTVIVF